MITRPYIWTMVGILVSATMASDGDLRYGSDLTAEQLLNHWMTPSAPPAPRLESSWKLDLNLGAGGGYKENVLYSSVQELNSTFSLVEIDAFLFRESTSPNQFYVYGFADQRHYVELDRADNEQMVIAEASWTRILDGPGAFNLRGTYTFLDQFFDASISDSETDTMRLFQHELGVSSFVEWEVASHLRLRVGVGGKTADLRDQDDDYDQFRALARIEYNRWPRWKAGLRFQHDYDDYDERVRRSATGERWEGETVAVSTESLTAYARKYWDRDRRWQTHLRLTGRMRNDDGGGYYDYGSWRGSLHLRGPLVGCRWEAGLYYGETDYDVRPSSYGDVASPLLRRSRWRVRLRVDRDVFTHLNLFSEIAHEDNDSNEPLDVYTQTWAVLGAGYRL